MTWRVADCLLVLRDEVDTAYPRRSKASDGTIGDAAHATRSSDHNPWIKDHRGVGVVRAIDITHDPRNGCDAGELAERFRVLGRAGDKRVSYVIWNRRIYNPSISSSWRTYSGSNPHTKHVHLSVSTDRRYYDSNAPWGITSEELTVADVDRIMKKLSNIDSDVAELRRRVEFAIEVAKDCRNRLDNERAARAGMEGRFGAELDEIRRNVRRAAAAAGYPLDLVEGGHTVADDDVEPLPVGLLLRTVQETRDMVDTATRPPQPPPAERDAADGREPAA